MKKSFRFNTEKFLQFIDRTPINPILLVIIFACIGWFEPYSSQKEDASLDNFFKWLNLGLTAAVIQCALIQNKIQKDNVKIQLFEKRYAVFQAVLDSITVIKRDNWDRFLLLQDQDNDVSKQMIRIEENLYESVLLSRCLFDKELHKKLVAVNNAFCEVVKSYKNMLVANYNKFISQEQIKAYSDLLKSHVLNDGEMNSIDFENDLKEKFPDIYVSIMDFSKKCDVYLSLIDNSHVIKDFGDYIMIDNLGK